MTFRYLGIPLETKRLGMSDYNPLLDFIIRHINSWLKKTLSYAGKVQLIMSILKGGEMLRLFIYHTTTT